MLSRRQAQLWNAVEVDAVEVVVSIFVVFIVVVVFALLCPGRM